MIIRRGVTRMTDSASSILTWVTSLGSIGIGATEAITTSTTAPASQTTGVLAVGLGLIAIATQGWSMINKSLKQREEDKIATRKKEERLKQLVARAEIKLQKEKDAANKESLSFELKKTREDLLAAFKTIEDKESVLQLRANIIAEQKERMEELENRLNGKISNIEEDRKKEADRRHDRNNEQDAILLNLKADAEEAKVAAAKAKEEAEVAKEEARIAKAKAESLQRTVAKNVTSANLNAQNVQELAKSVDLELPDTHIGSDTDVDVKTFDGLD